MDRYAGNIDKYAKGNLRLFTMALAVPIFLPLPPAIFIVFGELVGFAFCCFICVILLMQNKLKVNRNFLTFVFCFIILMLVGMGRDIDRVIISDFFELVRPLFWFFSYCLAYSLVDKSSIRQSIDRVMFILLVVAVWGVIESFLPRDFIFHKLYKIDASVYYGKAIASFIAPYSFAAVVGIGVIFYYAKAREKRFTFAKYNVIFLIFLAAIMLSQSKSAIGGVLVAILVTELSFKGKIVIFPIVMAFLCFCMYVALVWGSLSYVNQFLMSVLGAYEANGIPGVLRSSDSISNRWMQFQEAIELQDIVPLIGRGIGKGYLYLESLYALMLYRYGLIGCLLFLCSAYYFCFKIKRQNIYDLSPSERALIRSAYGIFVFFFMVSVSANVIDQFRVALIYFIVIALAHKCYMFNKKTTSW